jgi:peptidoglycan/LPS O-acetylase OafA/YrhL
LTHNGIDIDQFLLLTIYPSILFFGVGFIAKKTAMRESLKYALQALICIIFSIVYFVVIPHGGAQGLAIVLAILGVILLIMAKKYIVHPLEEEEKESEGQSTTSTDGT